MRYVNKRRQAGQADRRFEKRRGSKKMSSLAQIARQICRSARVLVGVRCWSLASFVGQVPSPVILPHWISVILPAFVGTTVETPALRLILHRKSI